MVMMVVVVTAMAVTTLAMGRGGNNRDERKGRHAQEDFEDIHCTHDDA